MRTWGFNDRNRTTVTGGLPQYGGEGAGPSPNVMQWWSNGTSEINLEPFDKVVKAAEKTGMKLLIALTNNWADYGGMDVYTVNLGGKYHDDVSPPLISTTRFMRDLHDSTVPSFIHPDAALKFLFLRLNQLSLVISIIMHTLRRKLIPDLL